MVNTASMAKLRAEEDNFEGSSKDVVDISEPSSMSKAKIVKNKIFNRKKHKNLTITKKKNKLKVFRNKHKSSTQFRKVSSNTDIAGEGADPQRDSTLVSPMKKPKKKKRRRTTK
jgi:hypothetical protein